MLFSFLKWNYYRLITDKSANLKKRFAQLAWLTAIFIFTSSCSNRRSTEFVAEASLSVEEKLKMQQESLKEIFSEGDVIIDSIPVESSYLSEFYAARDNALFWSNEVDTNHKGSCMIHILDSAWSYGLNPEWYHLSKIRSLIDSARKDDNYVSKAKFLAKSDILLSNAYFTFFTDLSAGFIDTASMDIRWKKDSLNFDLRKYLEESTDENFVERIYAYQPKHGEYVLLQKALSKYWRSTELWDDHYEIGDYKKDTVAFWNGAKAVFIRMKLLDTLTVQNDSLVREAMKKFQVLHAIDVDGKLGRQSFISLKKSNYDRFLQAALAMEKLRWKKRTKDFQFYVNIPAYRLTLIRNDSALVYFRVVVGTPEHKTPEFSAKLRYISLHPYWHLPHSIASKEFLPAAKRDTNYANKNSYKVFDLKNNRVPLSEVNWSKLGTDYFPYRVRQEGGYGNSLGLIVFYFPNKYDVYMHDTPAKYLFSRSVRAFSHGCMRVQEPFKVGEWVMKNDRPRDTINADTLKRMALMGYEQRLNLKKTIPIEVDYITTTADSSGQIYFHLDIYGRDEKYLEVIRRRENKKSRSDTGLVAKE
jgi:L,D-transpeptidase YcbB